jgi:hypothetical protein
LSQVAAVVEQAHQVTLILLEQLVEVVVEVLLVQKIVVQLLLPLKLQLEKIQVIILE